MIQYSEDLGTFIANKKECAKLFSVSESGFQKWGCKPLGKVKNEVYYDLCQLIQARLEEVKNTGSSRFTEERIRFLKARRQKAELEMKVLQRQYFPGSIIEEVWSNQISYFKAKLQVIPSKLSKVLASCKTAGKVKELLEKAVRETLSELSEYDNERYKKATSDPLHGIAENTKKAKQNA